MCVSLLTTTNGLFSRNCKKTTFLSRKFANTRSTKALRDSAAVHESQPTPATLGCNVGPTLWDFNYWSDRLQLPQCGCWSLSLQWLKCQAEINKLGRCASHRVIHRKYTFGKYTIGKYTFGKNTFGKYTFGKYTFRKYTFGKYTFGKYTFKKYTFKKYTFGKYTFGKYTFGIYTFGKYTKIFGVLSLQLFT